MQVIKGFEYYPEYLSQLEADHLLKIILNLANKSQFFVPKMPKTGKDFSVKMTNFGDFGWVSDKEKGYRYQNFHPITKEKWPKIPKEILNIWKKITKLNVKPDCCLVNFYNFGSKMGLHIDNDEKDFDFPVLSISLGASALFRYGGKIRKNPTKSVKLHHGDVMILKNESRLIYHGIDRIYQSKNFDFRLNLTLRKI